jgi:hypothetical protein
MKPAKLIQIDQEQLRNLKSLVDCARISLDGLDTRMKKELEVIGVARTMAEKATSLIDQLVEKPEEKT